MSKLELFVDNKSLPGSSIQMGDKDFIEAYTKFFRQTKMLQNPLAGELPSYNTFGVGGNVITAYNLSEIDLETGWLSVKIDFDTALTSNLLLIVYMIYDKTVTFEDGNITVHEVYKNVLLGILVSMKKSTTQYVLIPKNIFDRFFKDIKLGKSKISGILDETAIKEANRKSNKRQSRKRKKEESSESETSSSSSEDE